MDFVTPRPGETASDLKLGEVRAGQRKQRAAALIARRELAAEAAARRHSPDALDKRESDLDAADRQRREGAINDAIEAVERVKKLRTDLTHDRDEALASARNLPDVNEQRAALAEAASHDRKLSQIPAALDAALSAVADAREALKRFEATAKARAADRAANAEQRKASAEREAAARAAADALYAELMAEPAPKPATVKGKP